MLIAFLVTCVVGSTKRNQIKRKSPSMPSCQRTRSWMNFKHALLRSSINCVSSSLSVYHGPPVKAIDGSRFSSI